MKRGRWVLAVIGQGLVVLALGIGLWQQQREAEFTIEGGRGVPVPRGVESVEETGGLFPSAESRSESVAPVEWHPEAEAAAAKLRERLAEGLAARIGEVEIAGSTPWEVGGIEVTGRKVAFLIDDGGSTLTRWRGQGGTIEGFREKVARLLETLDGTRAIALVTFVRQVGTWRDDWQPATVSVQRGARVWIEEHVGRQTKETSFILERNGVEGALAIAAEMGAEVCVIIADGSFQRSPQPGLGTEVDEEDLRAWRVELAARCGVSPVWVWFSVAPTEEDRATMTRLVVETGGAVTEF